MSWLYECMPWRYISTAYCVYFRRVSTWDDGRTETASPLKGNKLQMINAISMLILFCHPASSTQCEQRGQFQQRERAKLAAFSSFMSENEVKVGRSSSLLVTSESKLTPAKGEQPMRNCKRFKPWLERLLIKWK